MCTSLSRGKVDPFHELFRHSCDDLRNGIHICTEVDPLFSVTGQLAKQFLPLQ